MKKRIFYFQLENNEKKAGPQTGPNGTIINCLLLLVGLRADHFGTASRRRYSRKNVRCGEGGEDGFFITLTELDPVQLISGLEINL